MIRVFLTQTFALKLFVDEFNCIENGVESGAAKVGADDVHYNAFERHPTHTHTPNAVHGNYKTRSGWSS